MDQVLFIALKNRHNSIKNKIMKELSSFIELGKKKHNV